MHFTELLTGVSGLQLLHEAQRQLGRLKAHTVHFLWGTLRLVFLVWIVYSLQMSTV